MEHSQKEMNQGTNTWVAGYDYLLEKNINHFKYFSQQHQTCELQPKTFVPPKQWVQ